MAKSFEVKKPPRRGGTFYPSSFSFLFGRKEKRKEAKRKEKPEEKIQLQMQNPCRSFTGRVLFVLEFNYYRLIPASRIL